ncbi:hypothetical protein Verru16b_02959 [Lacunisphaera limnophila]|uniref:Uncharacterized protein n=1 Tax=Lacunisphaera limnophila TaxID=1838286 RepID=A0A1D8AYA6_9BACT|nr:hypothetical protein Verru16b_02959 [Lacunisphaera limnophila]
MKNLSPLKMLVLVLGVVTLLAGCATVPSRSGQRARPNQESVIVQAATPQTLATR